MNEPKTSLAQILGLARAGASARAWELFTAAGWNARADDPAALTLKGRLLKDQAKMAEGPARATIFRHSADAYAAAAALAPATYPLINAASLALLSEDEARARDLARQVLELLDSGEHTPDTPYWLTATRAEALLFGPEPRGCGEGAEGSHKTGPASVGGSRSYAWAICADRSEAG
ncbi:MAG: tetratricopeptide repeat-containing protein [Parasphingorhabdus sp.]|nr:tetratricopeptide repeat-containing protein [Parasphingorhabdus sp.]